MNPRFDLNNQYVKVDNTCRYIGKRLGSKLTFKTHNSYVKKLSRQCEIILKLAECDFETRIPKLAGSQK